MQRREHVRSGPSACPMLTTFTFKSFGAGVAGLVEFARSECPAGSYCPAGATAGVACTTAGYYCPAGSSSPTQNGTAVCGNHWPFLGGQNVEVMNDGPVRPTVRARGHPSVSGRLVLPRWRNCSTVYVPPEMALHQRRTRHTNDRTSLLCSKACTMCMFVATSLHSWQLLPGRSSLSNRSAPALPCWPAQASR